MNSLKLDIPFYNAEKFIRKCLLSVLTQNYNNYHIILTNDASTDSSDKIIQEIIKMFPNKITYIKNETRMGAMFNHQRAAFEHCNSSDIVIHLDGDDWLSDKKALSYIDEFDNKRNVFQFYISHIRTFKAFLFHDIKRQDPELNCFKNQQGEWYSMTCDVAMMYPLMEICGYDKMKYNDKVLYIYNDSNPIQDFKINLQLQESIHREILLKKPFKKIDNEKYF